MRIDRGRWMFRSLEILLEDVTETEVLKLMRRYGRIVILSHHPLSLPESFRCSEKQTPNIYLTDPLETVFGRFRDTVRNEIRRTERLSHFEVCVPTGLTSNVYELYSRFEYAQGRAPFSRKYMEHFQFACAYDHGRPISAVAFYRAGCALRVFAIFSLRLTAQGAQDRELYKTVGYATKRVIYEICDWGKSQGAELLDLASVNHTDPSKASIAQFKEGFGARIEHEYQCVYESGIFSWLRTFGAWKARIFTLAHALHRS